jgi:hypothetical protein
MSADAILAGRGNFPIHRAVDAPHKLHSMLPPKDMQPSGGNLGGIRWQRWEPKNC